MSKADQFWSRVKKTDGCWLWTGSKNEKGYGTLGLGGRMYYAHRIAFVLAYDMEPGDGFVCHQCDNPSCVRPDHLFLGEVLTNTRDMVAKGRARAGLVKRKLSSKDARQIRELRRQGMRLKDLATHFNSTVEIVSHIVHGRTYKDLTPVIPDVSQGPCHLDLERGTHRLPFKPSLEEHFWSKVDRRSDCWTWLGSFYHHGYGRFHVGRQGKSAHRVAFELTYGPIPPFELVLHKCDNRACVRPDHLFLGSQADNMRDMRQKGRDRRPSFPGESNGNVKLNADQVKEIRIRYAEGASMAELAVHFQVCKSNIRAIVRKLSWRNI